MIVGSPRQALAHLYAHHRGPSLARPQYGRVPSDTGRSHWDGSIIGAMLYGPWVTGGCGIVRGSADDAEIQHWATHAGEDVPRTALILRVERRVRHRLRAEGMMLSHRRAPRVLYFKDRDNGTFASLLRGVEEISCARVQISPMVP